MTCSFETRDGGLDSKIAEETNAGTRTRLERRQREEELVFLPCQPAQYRALEWNPLHSGSDQNSNNALPQHPYRGNSTFLPCVYTAGDTGTKGEEMYRARDEY